MISLNEERITFILSTGHMISMQSSVINLLPSMGDHGCLSKSNL